MKASEYGIKNLKRIVPNLEKWTTAKGETYDEMATMYGQVLGQFSRYMGHVTTNVGGVYEYNKTADQAGEIYTHVSKERQRSAVRFLNKQLFATPNWMLDKNIFNKVQSVGAVERIRGLQVRTLNGLLNVGRMGRMIENETLNGSKAYNLVSFLL